MDMNVLEDKWPERALLIYTGRLTISEQEKEAIKRIVGSKKVNWFEFAKLALFHKIIVICWINLNNICSKNNIPRYLADIIQYTYKCTQIRNTCNANELKRFQSICNKKGITCIPVKGAYLLDKLYKDYGVRYSGDMDFLVRYEDICSLKEILTEMGYVNGVYSSTTKQIELITRESEIKWKIYMSNLFPFIKLSNNDIFPYYKLDFRYALDDTLNREPIREIVNFTIKNGFTRPAYYLVHMCTHFYDEAKHSASIACFKDINMIKLCDIREYILGYVSKDEMEIAIDFSVKHNLEKALYFSLYYLREIYSDGYENLVIDLLRIEDKSFLNTYGDSTLQDNYLHKKTFLERFFMCDSIDSLIEEPKLFSSTE